jgi:hypothetical protein
MRDPRPRQRAVRPSAGRPHARRRSHTPRRPPA